MNIFGELWSVMAGATAHEAILGSPPGTREWLAEALGDAVTAGTAASIAGHAVRNSASSLPISRLLDVDEQIAFLEARVASLEAQLSTSSNESSAMPETPTGLTIEEVLGGMDAKFGMEIDPKVYENADRIAMDVLEQLASRA